jgi:DNA-binding CsgD family transcriptional regulator
VPDPHELLGAAQEAMARGDGSAAAELLATCVEAGGPPVAHLLLGGLAYADDLLDDARCAYEVAFAAAEAGADLTCAARAAMLLAELHWGSLGNAAAGRGWIERSRRLLDEVGPCVENGYWELARLACDRPDVEEVAASAARALAIANEFGDRALEVRALADGGLALVTQGQVREGFHRLDEALALLSTGMVRDPYIVGTSLCSLLSSCDRAGDVERATEWIRLTEALVLEPTGGRPRVLGTHCKIAFCGVLSTAGRWREAEAAILEALGPEASACVGHHIEATARLAELRLHQGRLEDAAALLAPYEDAIVAAGAVGSLHLLRGEAAMCVAVLRRAVTQLVGDVLRGAPLLSTLVEAELAAGDHAGAIDAARLLRAMAAAVEVTAVTALADLAEGRIHRAEGEVAAAIASFESATACLGSGDRPLLSATAHLALAEAQVAAGDRAGAIVAARAAHATAARLDASLLCDRSAAVLRSLGAAPPRPNASATLDGLTAREHDVLDGIRRGDSNAEIAARLYLSPKTVEHHVGRVLAKLGARTRAEAAAVAASVRE